jgi:ABC-type multidrug transport system ATPase subunit
MSPALEFRQVTRRYSGRVALSALSFEVPERSVTAFVGANGAGKTTSFSLVGEFIRPHAGEISVFGVPLRQFRTEGGQIGLLPQDVQFYENRTVYRQLFLFARLTGLSVGESEREVSRVLELVTLTDRQGDRAEALSHGMRIRLGLAQALIGAPPLVMLDEPTAGLDPIMVQSFRGVVDRLRGTTTLIVSSHDLTVLQQFSDYVVMIDKGELLRQGALRQMLDAAARIRFRLAAPFEFREELAAREPALTISAQGFDLVVDYPAGTSTQAEVNRKIMQFLIERRVDVLEVTSAGKLEDLFVASVKK